MNILISRTLLSFFILSFVVHFSSAAVAKNEVDSLLNSFFKNLTEKNEIELKKTLHQDIVIQSYTSKQIKQYIDQLIMSEINEIEYLKIISSRNLFRFLNPYEEKIWKIEEAPTVKEGVFEDTVEASGKKIHYYFVNFQVNINIIHEATSASEKKVKKEGSVYFITEGNVLKIFGFLI